MTGAGRPGFSISRSFPAPAEQVFRLWTEPAYVSLWWGIKGSTIDLCELDVRVGGRWRIDMRTASGRLYRNEGEYLEVAECSRLAFSDIPDPEIPEWEGDLPGPRLHEVDFTPNGGTTDVTLNVSFENDGDLARHIAFGMPKGIAESFDRLDELVATMRAPSPG